MAEHHLEVLAVGDVVTDAFIKLADDQARIDKDETGPRLSLPFAAKVPFDHAEVVSGAGNAANAAVAFAKLGLKVGLVSNVGNDRVGREIIESLEDADVDSRFMHINPGKKSNYHYILWYKQDRTILTKHEEYAYHWPHFRVIDIPEWIYFSSVSKHGLEYHDQLSEWLDGHPPVKLAFQPGTFQISAGEHRLRRLYSRAEILAVNREEAAAVSGGDHGNIQELLDKLHELGPRIVLISDGHAGAYASDGVTRYRMPIYPDPKPPLERTGAGDAFTATFVAALIKGVDLQTALTWAPVNSMSVVQKVGSQAGLLTEHELSHFLRIAPESYHVERIR